MINNPIDEQLVESLCREVEDFNKTPDEKNPLLSNIDSLLGPPAYERTRKLRRLFSMQRIPDVSAWRVEVYRNTRGLSMMAHIQNNAAKLYAEGR